MSKLRPIDRPTAFCGKVTLEFFNNEDEEFKLRSLKSLSKELHKDFNVSCTVVEESMVENPERGTLVIALCGRTHDAARGLLDKVLAHIDSTAPARILLEEFEEAEIV